MIIHLSHISFCSDELHHSDVISYNAELVAYCANILFTMVNRALAAQSYLLEIQINLLGVMRWVHNITLRSHYQLLKYPPR